jgi:nucleoside-diphosphate-sugar epimerase
LSRKGKRFDVLTDEKILITGPSGQVGSSLAAYFARRNEVWGVARFRTSAPRERLEGFGVTTRSVDLVEDGLGSLPDDFTYILHAAAFQQGGLDFDYAIRVNAEAAGMVMHRYPQARGFLITSSMAVYAAPADFAHPLAETDPLGDERQPFAPTYAISKICEEAVVRATARALKIPSVIARLNCIYGPSGGLPSFQLDDIVAGRPVGVAPSRATLFNPLYEDDLNQAIDRLFTMAAPEPVVVNLAGDDTVSVEEWSDYLAGLVGRPVTFAVIEDPMPSRAADNARRLELLGAMATKWQEGMRRMVEARYTPADEPG